MVGWFLQIGVCLLGVALSPAPAKQGVRRFSRGLELTIYVVAGQTLSM